MEVYVLSRTLYVCHTYVLMPPSVSLLIVTFQLPIIFGTLLRSGIAFARSLNYEFRGTLECIEKCLIRFMNYLLFIAIINSAKWKRQSANPEIMINRRYSK